MNLIRKLTTVVLGVAFSLTLAVVATEAQPGRARWEGNRGLHRGWSIGRHRGWGNRGRRVGWNNSQLTWRERRRLARQRYSLMNTRNRFLRDGYLSPSERRRLRNRAMRYRRNVYRESRDW